MGGGIGQFARAVAGAGHDPPAASTSTAPTGTSPRAAALRASSRAISMMRCEPHGAPDCRAGALSQARELRYFGMTLTPSGRPHRQGLARAGALSRREAER
jgi:hypothetical protein